MLLLKIMGICRRKYQACTWRYLQCRRHLHCSLPILKRKRVFFFFSISSVRTKLIVLTVLSDDYFKLNFHWPMWNEWKKKKERKNVEGKNPQPPLLPKRKTIVSFQRCKDDNWIQLDACRYPIQIMYFQTCLLIYTLWLKNLKDCMHLFKTRFKSQLLHLQHLSIPYFPDQVTSSSWLSVPNLSSKKKFWLDLEY